jgi:hypothetical protein
MQKFNTMSFLTFLTSVIVLAAILFIIRLLWPVMIVVFYLLNILWWSFVAAVIWAAFVVQTSEGWVYTWMLVFLAFCGVFVVVYLAVLDVFGRFLTMLKGLIK